MQFGDPGDIPVPGDYNGDGTTDIAVFRPSTGQWFVRDQFTVQWGDRGDIPMPGDFNGDGVDGHARCSGRRPATGWCATSSTCNFGGPGDVPVPGDYNGDGTDDVAIYPPVDGQVVRAESVGRAVSATRATGRCRATTTATARRISRCIGRRRASGSCGASSPCSSATPGISRCRATTRRRHDGCRGLPAVDAAVVRAGSALQFRSATAAISPVPLTAADPAGDRRRLRRQRRDRHLGVSAVDRTVVRAQSARRAVRRLGRHAGAGRLQRRSAAWTWRCSGRRPATGSCATSRDAVR